MTAPAHEPAWAGSWFHRLVSRPGFQVWAAHFPIARWRARADGAEIFDIVQGFVQSQVLLALVELDVFRRLQNGVKDAETLGRACDVPRERMQVLMQAGAALGFFRRNRRGFRLARKGAALLGVPGLEAMIRHHSAFYEDLRDPVALLRGPRETNLARFWPYVFGDDIDPSDATLYSDLMAQTQRLVAADTLRAVSLRDVRHLLDVGGGTGAFLEAAGLSSPRLQMTLFDLPQVVPAAHARFAKAGLADRARVIPGSFREGILPKGADAISLVRVLYDHDDETVSKLLEAAYAALPDGGRIIISEPMGGGAKPDRFGDVYFAFYTMAMQTGRARSQEEIGALLEAAGFADVRILKPARPYITRILTAQKRNGGNVK